MTWFKTSDDFTDSDAYARAGKDARALLLHVGIQCAKRNSDGRVPAFRMREWMAAAEVTRTAARQLVKVGYWHDDKTLRDCSACLADIEDLSVELDPADFYWHGWRADQIEHASKDDPVRKKRELRRKALNRDQRLKAMIRERDRDLCRYCGCLTSWGADHKSPGAGTFDHVDPWGDNSLANCVVACRKCNGRKRDRTPEQAGMVLLEPSTAGYPAADPDHGSDIQPESTPIPRDGTGTGSGRVSGSDPAGSGSGRIGSRPGSHTSSTAAVSDYGRDET